MAVADVDLERLRQERMRTVSFNATADAAGNPELAFRKIPFEFEPSMADVGLERHIDRFPFVPDDALRLDLDCYEAFNIQVQGLAKRLEFTGSRHIVIGVSGGLDSTHALLVAARTFDSLGIPRANILGFTMPGFATSEGTKSNAWKLMKAVGITGEEIDIRPAAKQMLEGLKHPFSRGGARLRRDLRERAGGAAHRLSLQARQPARRHGARHRRPLGAGAGLVHLRRGRPHEPLQRERLGVEDAHPVPGALGGGLGQVEEAVAETLKSILGTEISPELVPAQAGKLQSTESQVGPYELQDFNLYYLSRFGLRPSKIAFLAWHAWRDAARGPWPPCVSGGEEALVHAGRDPQVARSVPHPLLPEPVQALGAAEWPEGRGRRKPLAARRLARALRWQRTRVAGGAEERNALIIFSAGAGP
jgi:NAD+ synthase (glutamine-hydrolysing)